MSTRYDNLVVSSAPHIVNPVNTASIMKDVLIALVPAMAMAVYVFGPRALVLTGVCMATCVISEGLTRKILGRSQTIGDFSAAVTGVILSFNLPANFPLWMAAIGSIVSIVVVKQLFGGLGQNFANPAIVGRIVLFISFPTQMSTWTVSNKMAPEILSAMNPDTLTGPTPLGLFQANMNVPSGADLFIGNINGSMGEISAIALIIGGIYLIIKKVIEPTIPVSFIATVALVAVANSFDPIFHVCAGGVMLGAIFMATDYVTSPITTKGKILFGIGCGFLTMMIRLFAAYPEGVSFAILIMNILTPHIDEATRTTLNGVPKPSKRKKGGAASEQ